MQWGRTTRARLDDESGMSLLEVVIATFVLAVAIVALASVASASLIQLRTSRDRQAATDAATSKLETMRLSEFSSVAMYGPEAPAQTCGAMKEEPFVTTADQPNSLSPYQDAGLGPKGNITVETRVTWYDDPDHDADGDGSGTDACSTVPKRVKRVTVEASWLDRGVRRSVVEETLVSPANRGLPLPSFRLGNPAATQHFETSEVNGGVEKCVEHLLRNVGAPDRYDLLVRRGDGSEVPPTAAGPSLSPPLARWYEFPVNGQGSGNGSWWARAELLHGSPVTTTHYTADVAGTRRIRHADALVIGTGGEATLRVCYRSDGLKKVALNQSFDFEVVAYSRFDDNENHAVRQTITTGTQAKRWYLYDIDDATPHSRTNSTIYPMGPPQSAQPDRLRTAAEGPLVNYSTNESSFPGLELEDDGGDVASWHEQMTQTTTFASTMDLVLWVSTPSALSGGSPPTAPQKLLVKVRVLRTNESGVFETFQAGKVVSWTQTESAVGTDDGWQEQRWSIDLSGSLSVSKNRFLQLQVSCHPDSTEDCELAYDHEKYPSRLEVVTP